MMLERATISCDACERLWTLGCALSIYEQQSLESRPCPHCGAYTLSMHTAEEVSSFTFSAPIAHSAR
jgi:uncharacterized protein CbrC (UPF0167 family)